MEGRHSCLLRRVSDGHCPAPNTPNSDDTCNLNYAPPTS